MVVRLVALTVNTLTEAHSLSPFTDLAGFCFIRSHVSWQGKSHRAQTQYCKSMRQFADLEHVRSVLCNHRALCLQYMFCTFLYLWKIWHKHKKKCYFLCWVLIFMWLPNQIREEYAEYVHVSIRKNRYKTWIIITAHLYYQLLLL